MKTKLLLAGASVLALTWSMSTQAENIGVGVLEPQAVLHISGEVGNADDVIIENLNVYDGTDDTENVLLIDEDDGQRVKTVPLTSLTNSSFSFDGGTNILSITEGGVTRTVDLSDLQDSINDTNTTIVSLDYATDTNILTIVDSDLNQFDVDLTDLEDALTALNLGNSDLVQTPTDTVRTYDISGQTLNFTNGAFIVGDSPRAAGTESHFQGLSVHAGRGYIETPAVYTQIIEALTESGSQSTGIAIGLDGHFNSAKDFLTLFTHGARRLIVGDNGALNFVEYGANKAKVSGDAANDKYLTVNSVGDVREVDAPIDTDSFLSIASPSLEAFSNGTIAKTYPYTAADGTTGQITFEDSNTDRSATLIDNQDGSYTFQESVIAGQPAVFPAVLIDTIQNTAASLDAQNVLTITDEAGDVTVDLSSINTDTFLSIASPSLEAFSNGTIAKTYPYTAADGTTGQITFEDSNTDRSATLIDNQDGSYTFQESVIAGQPAVFPAVLIDTIQNTAASLDAQNVLTITDEAGDVTVDLSGLATTLNDTTVSNTGATLDNATNVLTITDETGDVTVDLSSIDTDTFVSFGLPIDLQLSSGTRTRSYSYTAADGSLGTLEFQDQDFDQSATLTDNQDGSYTFRETVISGQPIAFDPVVIDTIQNNAASLDAQNVLTITDEAGDVTVDLSSIDTDTTDLDWAVSGSASNLSTAIGDSIYTNGNVGINTNAPSYPLVVDTAATQNALVVREATEGGQTLGRVGVGTDTPGYSLDVSGDIRATGSIYSGDQFLASNFFQTSDRRLKTEIEGFNRGLEILRQMRLVSYRYNGLGLPTNTERLHYGVIAQELHEIDPALVGSFYSPEENMDYLTVNVQSMTYVLANALQQLDAENARITAVLLDSETRITNLEKRLRLMEARLGVSDQ